MVAIARNRPHRDWFYPGISRADSRLETGRMMGFLSDLFERRSALPLNDNRPWFESNIMQRSHSGVRVTPESSLKYAAVLACVRVLAESVASLPLMVYERQAEDTRRKANNFYLYRLLHDKPNPELTSFEWREILMAHLLLWGNAYCEIEYNGRGQPTGLWPLMPNAMLEIKRRDGMLEYKYQLPNGSGKTFAAWQLLHIRGLGLDGLAGMSPIGMARQAVGLGLAAEEFGSKFFGNGANMSGVLSHPGVMGDEAFDRLKEQWDSLYSGLNNAQRTAILEEGMQYERIGIPPEDAQFLETRKFQTSEIARIYRVPPHMIGDLERATFSNIEHQSLEFVMHSLRPWLVRWEQAISERLMTKRERSRYYPEFLITGLLRGDSAARSAYYTSMFNIGAMSQNDIRRAENLNPVPSGDEYYVPLNMIPASQAGLPAISSEPGDRSLPTVKPAPTLETRQQRSATARHRLQRIHLSIFEDVAGRILRREANDVSNAAARFLNKRTVPEFTEWLDEFYAGHAEFSAAQWRPVLAAYASLVAGEAGAEVNYVLDDTRLDAFIQSYAEMLGVRQSQRSRARIDSILEDFGEDALAEIQRTTDGWRDTRPGGVANEETVRSGNAAAKLVYVAAGIQLLRWFAVGDSCPYCSEMNGRVVGATGNFLNAGETIGMGAPNGPLTPSRDVGHPPVHKGCDCQVVAG